MSDEYGRHERHHHRRENEDEYDNAPPRDSDYGYQQPPRRDEYSQEGYSGDYGGRPQGDGYGRQPYGGGRPSGGGYGQQDPVVTDVYQATYPTEDGIAQDRVEVRRHKREEEEAGFGGMAAGAYALYERHEEKKDPEHAARHKLEEELAGAGAVGAEGFAFHERHEKREGRKNEEELSGEKKHGWFG